MSIIGNIYGLAGYYNHSRGFLDKAEVLYSKGLARGMNKPNFRLAYGVLLLRKEQYEKARQLFSEVLLSSSDKKIQLTAKQNLSLAYWKLGDIQLAVDMIKEVHSRMKSAKSYGVLGYLLIEQGSLDEALKVNLEALDYDDGDSVIVDNLAQNYYFLGEKDKAKEFFLKAEKLKPDQAATQYYLGCLFEEEGLHESAVDKFNKALTCSISPLSTITKRQIQTKLDEIN